VEAEASAADLAEVSEEASVVSAEVHSEEEAPAEAGNPARHIQTETSTIFRFSCSFLYFLWVLSTFSKFLCSFSQEVSTI
jgi:hypothetical protein